MISGNLGWSLDWNGSFLFQPEMDLLNFGRANLMSMTQSTYFLLNFRRDRRNRRDHDFQTGFETS